VAGIHPGTTLGQARLAVRDLEGAVRFYTRALGLSERGQQGPRVSLGTAQRTLVLLEQAPGAARRAGTAGLYHLALLLPSRFELARALERLLKQHVPLEGFADHLVSEAIYLSDPEGNGIELYRDRPRESWTEPGGKLRMGTYELDPHELLAELEGPQPAETEGARLGHVHLEVGDLAASDRFYLGVLGFQLMMRMGPSASFVSAGGYHHHIGYNTWAGHLAPAPRQGVLGLERFSILLPDPGALETVLENVRRAGLPMEQDDGGWVLRDPSGIRISLELRAQGMVRRLATMEM
jgi:catechol 2,3-dioxygenase